MFTLSVAITYRYVLGYEILAGREIRMISFKLPVSNFFPSAFANSMMTFLLPSELCNTRPPFGDAKLCLTYSAIFNKVVENWIMNKLNEGAPCSRLLDSHCQLESQFE